MMKAAKASQNLGLTAHATFSGALAWPFVYPWPQQLQFDKRNSEHVEMWRNFCEKKCHKFIDFFPFFFDAKEKNSFIEVYKKYYFWNDVHFNKEGNRVIAERLLKEF